MPSLTVQSPGGEPEYYEFDDPQITIGRSLENSIIIQDDSLSSSHAQLVRNEDGSYTLMDLGSTNGTYVDGEPISSHLLGDSASLAFGQVTAFWQATAGQPGEALGAAPEAASVGGFQVDEFKPMGRPSNFRSISPIAKRVKKDPLAAITTGLGILSLLCAAALAGGVWYFLVFLSKDI